MIRKHTCFNCGYYGQIWIPYNAINTVIECPKCKCKEDVSYYLTSYKTLEEYEREMYEYLKKKYGGR
jgi:hypothetical protein